MCKEKRPYVDLLPWTMRIFRDDSQVLWVSQNKAWVRIRLYAGFFEDYHSLRPRRQKMVYEFDIERYMDESGNTRLLKIFKQWQRELRESCGEPKWKKQKIGPNMQIAADSRLEMCRFNQAETQYNEASRGAHQVDLYRGAAEELLAMWPVLGQGISVLNIIQPNIFNISGSGNVVHAGHIMSDSNGVNGVCSPNIFNISGRNNVVHVGCAQKALDIESSEKKQSENVIGGMRDVEESDKEEQQQKETEEESVMDVQNGSKLVDEEEIVATELQTINNYQALGLSSPKMNALKQALVNVMTVGNVRGYEKFYNGRGLPLEDEKKWYLDAHKIENVRIQAGHPLCVAVTISNGVLVLTGDEMSHEMLNNTLLNHVTQECMSSKPGVECPRMFNRMPLFLQGSHRVKWVTIDDAATRVLPYRTEAMDKGDKDGWQFANDGDIGKSFEFLFRSPEMNALEDTCLIILAQADHESLSTDYCSHVILAVPPKVLAKSGYLHYWRKNKVKKKQNKKQQKVEKKASLKFSKTKPKCGVKAKKNRGGKNSKGLKKKLYDADKHGNRWLIVDADISVKYSKRLLQRKIGVWHEGNQQFLDHVKHNFEDTLLCALYYMRIEDAPFVDDLLEFEESLDCKEEVDVHKWHPKEEPIFVKDMHKFPFGKGKRLLCEDPKQSGYYYWGQVVLRGYWNYGKDAHYFVNWLVGASEDTLKCSSSFEWVPVDKCHDV